MIRRYQDGIAVDVQTIRRRDASGAMVDAEAAYIIEEGVRRQVWPERLYLYKPGDECVAATGGWSASALGHYISNTGLAPTASRGTSSITITASSGYHIGSIWTEKQIDMTAYKTLKFHFLSLTAKKNAGHNAYTYLASSILGVVSEKIDGFVTNGKNKKSVEIFHANEVTRNDFTIEVNLSEVIGMQYVVLWYESIASDITMAIDNIWLET